MRIGRFQLSPFLLVFWVIVIVIGNVLGSEDSHNETSDSTLKSTLENELNESDLIHFVSTSTKANDIVVALFYETGCQSSMQLVPLWKEAISQLRGYELFFAEIRLPLVSTFLVTPSNKSFLQTIPVTHVPSIIFLSRSDDPAASLNILEFEGQRSSASEILKGLGHYLLRFQYSGFQAGYRSLLPHTSVSNALTVQVDGIEEMGLIVRKFQEMMFQRMNVPLDPIMPPAERDWVRYMLDENTDADFLHVICQCQHIGVSADDAKALNEVHSAFDDVARVLSLRRDVVFCVESSCVDEGVIKSYRVAENDWTLALESSLDPKSLSESDLRNTISFFCQGVLRPSILWLDRQASAPIIFAPNNRLHAALFLDFHNLEQKERMRQTVVEFRRECKARRVHNLVCFIVPSTDVRFLVEFGIDMWSPLDQKLYSENHNSFPSITVFPCLIVTDQRNGIGIQHRVLQHPFTRRPIGGFLDSVINDETGLKPQAAQHHVAIRKNTSGVRLLGASNLQAFTTRKDTSLIMFYSPSCGHCKRLKVVWNGLGKLLDYCGLDHRLQIGMYDVSTNELHLAGINVLSVPEVYLFSLGSDPIRYDVGEAGAINDPIDILEWWIDTSKRNGVEAIVERELLSLLEGGETP